MKKILFVALGLALVTGVVVLFVSPVRHAQFGMMDAVMKGNVVSMPSEPLMMMGEVGDEMMRPPYMPPYDDPSIGLDTEERFYDQYSDASYVVTDVDTYLRSLREFLLSQGARITSYSQGTSREYAYGNLSAEVPMDVFDAVMVKTSEGVETVVGENQSIVDVTGRVVQLENQQRALEQQIEQLRLDRAEAQTAADRSRIDLRISDLERQLQNLITRSANVQESTRYGTLNLSVADDMRYFDPSARGSWQEELRRAFKSLGESMQTVSIGLIWVVVYAVIWIPVLLAGRWLFGYLKKPAR